MAACDHEIGAQLTRFEDKSGGQALAAEPRQRKPRRTEPGFDTRQHLPSRRGRGPHPDQWHRRPYYERRYQGRVVSTLVRRAPKRSATNSSRPRTKSYLEEVEITADITDIGAAPRGPVASSG